MLMSNKAPIIGWVPSAPFGPRSACLSLVKAKLAGLMSDDCPDAIVHHSLSHKPGSTGRWVQSRRPWLTLMNGVWFASHLLCHLHGGSGCPI